MKIGMSLVDLALGGAQAFMVQLAQGLAGRGHYLSYFVYADRNDPVHYTPSLAAELARITEPVTSPRQLLG
jgi:hypothetical protein